MNSFQRSNISHVGTQLEVNFENLKHKLVHATWMLLKLILLSERSQTKKEHTLYGYIDIKILVHCELSSCVVTEYFSGALGGSRWEGGIYKMETSAVMGLFIILIMMMVSQ